MSKIIKTSNSSKRHPRQRLLLVLVALLLVLVGAASSYFYLQNSQIRTPQEGTPTFKKMDNAALAAEINKLVDEKKYTEAQELIKYQDEASMDPSKVVMQAHVLSEQGNYEAATKLLKDAAAKNDKNAYFYTGHEAQVLAASGDKQAAIDKYTTALDILSRLQVDPKDEGAVLDKITSQADYERAISRLRGE